MFEEPKWEDVINLEIEERELKWQKVVLGYWSTWRLDFRKEQVYGRIRVINVRVKGRMVWKWQIEVDGNRLCKDYQGCWKYPESAQLEAREWLAEHYTQIDRLTSSDSNMERKRQRFFRRG